MQQRTVTCYGQSNSIPAGKKKLYTTYIREATLPHTGLRWRTLTDGSLWNEPGRYTVTDYISEKKTRTATVSRYRK